MTMRGKNLIFADIALWSLYDYLLLVTYYRDFLNSHDYETKRLKALVLMAELLLLSDEQE